MYFLDRGCVYAPYATYMATPLEHTRIILHMSVQCWPILLTNIGLEYCTNAKTCFNVYILVNYRK